ncbi:ATP-binding protein [Candidatus Woesearchaeota archaeon]|nr:ATP-binding protein [Candidatus Woesearchaeota archaeon]
MPNKEILRQIVSKQKKELSFKPGSIRREVLDKIMHWFKDDRIIILMGIRRCGKSTLLKQIMDQQSKWCYINFEDERLLDFKAQDFEMLNEVLMEFYGQVRTYFFDEIQNIEKFETFVRRLQDEGKKVVITGSNATLLSKEFGTRLTGRYKAFEVYPFSFREFLSFNKIVVEKRDWYDLEKKVKVLKLFQEYLLSGGLPEYLKNRDKDYVRTVYENILYKDIITRYSIKKEKIIKELVNLLASNATLPFTYNSLKKSIGLSNAITVKEYISYFNNSYLFFELLKFSNSIKRQLASPRKIYLIDSAFNQVCGLNFTPNQGRNLENAVFIELKRRDQEIYYYSDEKECDFVIKEGTKITQVIQVCYVLEHSNREREIKGILEAMNYFKLKEGLILTFEQTEELELDGKKIKILPVFRWMNE